VQASLQGCTTLGVSAAVALGLYDEYRIAAMRVAFDPAAVSIFWVPRAKMLARTNTMHCLREVSCEVA
jgi:hypothetical protein